VGEQYGSKQLSSLTPDCLWPFFPLTNSTLSAGISKNPLNSCTLIYIL
jgi:hypothetical protein